MPQCTECQGRFRGYPFYEQILADFSAMSVGQMALHYQAPKGTIAGWIHRAKRYRDRGEFRDKAAVCGV